MRNRVFLVVLDSFGVGEAPDAADFGDFGVNTLKSVSSSGRFDCPNLKRLGLFNLDGINFGKKCQAPVGSFARLQEHSKGKDTVIGHWEISGIESDSPMPTYPNGFPGEIISEFEKQTGRKALCNRPYSGTEVIRDYGEEHMRTGALIVYTSADSVFQIAANEAVVPVAELYDDCQIARRLLTGRNGVGRVIARPFIGDSRENFQRTPRRHDYALKPPKDTMLNFLEKAGKDVLAVGKINDIFAGSGITDMIRTSGNSEGIRIMNGLLKRDFNGLAFVNLVDFDMLYGHRRDIDGYAGAMTEFDRSLDNFLPAMQPNDLIIITADHGCDPAYKKTTDHTREYVPCLIYGPKVRHGVNLGTLDGFGHIAASVCDYFGVPAPLSGHSFLPEIL